MSRSSFASVAAAAAAVAAAIAADAPSAAEAACCAFSTAASISSSASSNFRIASKNIEYPSPLEPSTPASAAETRTANGADEIASSPPRTTTCASTVPSAHAIEAGQNTRKRPCSASTASNGSHPRARASRWRHSR